MRFFAIAFVAILIFLPLNILVVTVLRRAHPRWRTLTTAITVAGNLLWPFLGLVLHTPSTALSRFLRATLGPPWFGWILVLVLYASWIAAMAVLWLALSRWRGVGFVEFVAPRSGRLIVACAIIGAIGLYQALVPLRIEKVPIRITSLDPRLEGYRIALISDLHVGLFSRPSRLRQIVSAISESHPDAVLVAGDNIDDDPFFDAKFAAPFALLPSSLPVYAVLGNHEMYGDPHDAVRRLRGSRVRLLVNEGVQLRKNGGSVYLAGISDYAARGLGRRDLLPDPDAALAGRSPGQTAILLAHQPKAFGDARKRNVELTLCGHTHGGQFAIRPLHWTLAGVFLPFDMGLYNREGHQLYVNTGTGYWMLPFRFGITPEITIIELHK
ncbi:MAG TPA: metallophosphoesterase [Thermoanaerobaculia bacterium]|nr:metallophosphoesterase [Thermoanaerobaculia bacterium]